MRVRLRVPAGYGPLSTVRQRAVQSRTVSRGSVRRALIDARRRLGLVAGRGRGGEPGARLPVPHRRPADGSRRVAERDRAARASRPSTPRTSSSSPPTSRPAEWAGRQRASTRCSPTGSRARLPPTRASCPDWAIAGRLGRPGRRWRRPPARTSSTAATSTASPSTSTTWSRLGVTLLYLTPVFPAASNHRYDATSFDEVDPLLGGDEALVRLVEAAHARGIRVIGDLTSNHSGDRARVVPGRAPPPGRARRASSTTSRMTERRLRVLARRAQPAEVQLERRDELRRRFIEGPDSVVARWLQPPFNLDGWRIDVANMTGRLGAEDLNAEVRQTIRRTMLEVNPDTILLGESTNDAASDFQGDAWHGAMTYPNFTRPLWSWLCEPGSRGGWRHRLRRRSGSRLHRAAVLRGAHPVRRRLPLADAARHHERAGHARHPALCAPARCPGAVPVALGLSVTLPGIPVVFAGDEFGLIGVDGEALAHADPLGARSRPEAGCSRQTLPPLRRADRACGASQPALERRRHALAARRRRRARVRARVGVGVRARLRLTRGVRCRAGARRRGGGAARCTARSSSRNLSRSACACERTVLSSRPGCCPGWRCPPSSTPRVETEARRVIFYIRLPNGRHGFCVQ